MEIKDVRFYGVKFSAVLLFLTTLMVTVCAQAPPPVQPPLSTLSVTPQFTKAVVGLSFDTTTHQQRGNFTVSVNMGAPPPGQFYLYGWSSVDNALTFDSPTAASTGAHATGTGIYYATCSVSLVKIEMTGELPMITLMNSGSGSSECAAIGGPISVSVSGNEKPTYNHDKNDPTKSWYLTNYGSGLESTHKATMTIGGQPTITRLGKVKGTTITWTLPGSTTTSDPTTSQITLGSITSQPLSILVKATGAFKDGVPKVQFHFDDGVISGDADDDSDSTQYSVTDPTTHAVTWKPLVYKVSGHVPQTLVRATPATSDQTVTQPYGATYWTNVARIKYILQDSGDAMPGVYVQERFTDLNPYGLTTNKETGFVWYTLLNSTLDSGSVSATDGIFNQFDFLSFVWSTGSPAAVTTTHSYYGGTIDASSLATTGIFLGSYTITFSPGQPGTATQADPPPPQP